MKQLIDEFAKKENIPLNGAKTATILLGRDTRPSGESLVEAAKQVRILIIKFTLFYWEEDIIFNTVSSVLWKFGKLSELLI